MFRQFFEAVHDYRDVIEINHQRYTVSFSNYKIYFFYLETVKQLNSNHYIYISVNFKLETEKMPSEAAKRRALKKKEASKKKPTKKTTEENGTVTNGAGNISDSYIR